MNRFCTNCGSKLNENAAFCIKCGVATTNYNSTAPVSKNSNGLGIASMIMGIIGTFTSFITLFFAVCILIANEYFNTSDKIIFVLFFLLLPTIISVTGLVLSLINKQHMNTGINITGLILGFISTGFCFLSVLVLVLI